MSHLHFSDFEQYRAAILNADLRMRVLGFERPEYSITHASVGRFQIQCAHEGSGQLTEGVTDRRAAGLYMQLNERPRIVNGMKIDPGAVVYFPPGSEFCFACDHANSWFSVRVPLDILDGADDRRSPLETPDKISVVRPSSSLVRRLRRMVPQYLESLNQTPLLASSTAATQAFEDTMSSIARQVALRGEARPGVGWSEPSAPRARRQKIASDAADLIESTLDGQHSVSGMARLLSVSERTLLSAFHSRFGVSPRRFIQSMRLNKARQVLRNADPRQVRIAEVAAECGYWDFGRFAARYQQLFGELPSETLRG